MKKKKCLIGALIIGLVLSSCGSKTSGSIDFDTLINEDYTKVKSDYPGANFYAAQATVDSLDLTRVLEVSYVYLVGQDSVLFNTYTPDESSISEVRYGFWPGDLAMDPEMIKVGYLEAVDILLNDSTVLIPPTTRMILHNPTGQEFPSYVFGDPQAETLIAVNSGTGEVEVWENIKDEPISWDEGEWSWYEEEDPDTTTTVDLDSGIVE